MSTYKNFVICKNSLEGLEEIFDVLDHNIAPYPMQKYPNFGQDRENLRKRKYWLECLPERRLKTRQMSVKELNLRNP